MPACAEIPYRLVGTAAALLRGVPLPAADIDILVRERADVDAFGAALAPFPCLFTPAWLPEARQYYANYDVQGVEVGISTVEVETEADTVETFGRGPWQHFDLLPVGPYSVPVVALELRLLTELFRDRPDRFTPIMGFLRERGADLKLIRRGLDRAGVPPERRDAVLSQFSGAG